VTLAEAVVQMEQFQILSAASALDQHCRTAGAACTSTCYTRQDRHTLFLSF